MAQPSSALEYVGFWLRVGASLIDSIVVLIVTTPLLILVFGRASDLGAADFVAHPEGFLIEWVLPAIAVIAFWIARQATPGKMLIHARIVDARTGGNPTPGQALARYLGYFVSTVPLGLGLLWVAFDPRKQGWHDKIAGTVVVRPSHSGAAPVHFEAR